MAVDVSKRTAQIRTAVYGKDVRENIAGGIEDIAGDVNQFENITIQRQNDFEDKITDQQNGYESKVTNEWSDYKEVMDADEATRKSNEQSRINNEDGRITSEDTRKQSEITRQNNETERTDNEQARETAFAGMEHVDANLELSTARGTFSTLNDRLDNSDGENLGTEELISINHNFDFYPNVRCICTNYGAGVGEAGNAPAGGTESYMVNARVCYLDTNSIKIYVPKHYTVRSPIVEKIDDKKYLIASNDAAETKSILINLTEVA